MRRWILIVTFALLAVLHSRARACSAPYCSPSVLAPPTGAIIPSNAPALFFDPARVLDRPATGAADVTLLDGAGMAVPMDALTDPQFTGGVQGSPYLLIPRTPLTPSASYRLRFSAPCGGDKQDGGVPLTEQAFTTSAAVPQPATAGDLKIAPQRTQTITVSTRRGSCVYDIVASTAAFELQPSEELKPWLPLARFTTTVDGILWASTGYGADPAASATYRGVETVFAACPPSDPSDDSGLSLGPHHVELQVHIAGATTDPPPLSVEVNLTCPDAPKQTGGCSVGDRFASPAGSTAASTSGFSLLLVFTVLALLRRPRIHSGTPNVW